MATSRILLAAVVTVVASCQNAAITSDEGVRPMPVMPSSGHGNLDAAQSVDASATAPTPPANPSTDGSADGAPIPEEQCAGEAHAAKRVPVDLLLVVDRSGSMGGRAPGGKSKWEMAQGALITFLRDPKSAGLGAGLQFFPLVSTCTTDIDCGGPRPGVAVCQERKACIGPTGMVGAQCGSVFDAPCPMATPCAPLGVCSLSVVNCTNVGQPCAGGMAGDMCLATLRTCRNTAGETCAATDYARLAVPIGDLPANGPPLNSLLAQTTVNGGTPTTPAVEAGLEHLRARTRMYPDRKQVLVLVTDGLPNSCSLNPVATITGIIETARMGTPSIPTYAIGVFTGSDLGSGGAALRDWAMAGGTGTPFVLNPTDDLGGKLLDALNQIRGSALPCQYTIPPPTMGMLDYDKLNVHVKSTASGQDLGYVTSADKCDPDKGGWHYDTDPATGGTPSTVIMCDATCKKFKADPSVAIELRYGCKTIIIQ